MWIYVAIVFIGYLTAQGEGECEPGKYGDACNKNCSQNCFPLPNGKVLCEKETGKCFEGCKVGVYGDRCDELCSKNCLGNTCDQHSGHCTLGCIGNHIGVFCEIPNRITIVHQGTTYSSHVAPTGSSQSIYLVVVTVLGLSLVFVGSLILLIWCIKKAVNKKRGSEDDLCSAAPLTRV